MENPPSNPQEPVADTLPGQDLGRYRPPLENGLSRLENLYGRFRVTAGEPDWTPGGRTLDMFAVDTAANRFWYYDFENSDWSYVALTTLNVSGEDPLIGAVILAAGDGITISQAGQTITISLIGSSPNTSTLVAGEALTAQDTVVIGINETAATTTQPSGGIDLNVTNENVISGTNLVAQTFTAVKSFLTKVELELAVGGSGDRVWTMSIQTVSANVPTGTQLANGSTTYSKSSGAPESYTGTFLFSTPVLLTPGSTYAIVLSVDTGGVWRYTNGTVYSGGRKCVKTGTWASNTTDDLVFTTYESATISGKLFRSDASNNDQRANGFVGFIGSSYAEGATATFQHGGIMTGFTGLTPGATYYLSDTTGAISTSAGSQSRKAGVALSSTTLLIKLDNA